MKTSIPWLFCVSFVVMIGLFLQFAHPLRWYNDQGKIRFERGRVLPAPVPQTKPANSPLLIAHRGASSAYPENTLPALIAAFESGATYVELDVLMSSDNVPVCFHDEDLGIFSNGSGLVADTTFAHLSQLTVGKGRFEEDGTIPSLAEALAYAGEGRNIIVDAKVEVFGAILEEVIRSGKARHVFLPVYSVSDAALIQQSVPDIRLYFDDYFPTDVKTLSALSTLGVEAILTDWETLTSEQIDMARNQGIAVWAYGARSSAAAKLALSVPLDGVYVGSILNWASNLK